MHYCGQTDLFSGQTQQTMWPLLSGRYTFFDLPFCELINQIWPATGGTPRVRLTAAAEWIRRGEQHAVESRRGTHQAPDGSQSWKSGFSCTRGKHNPREVCEGYTHIQLDTTHVTLKILHCLWRLSSAAIYSHALSVMHAERSAGGDSEDAGAGSMKESQHLGTRNHDRDRV